MSRAQNCGRSLFVSHCHYIDDICIVDFRRPVGGGALANKERNPGLVEALDEIAAKLQVSLFVLLKEIL